MARTALTKTVIGPGAEPNVATIATAANADGHSFPVQDGLVLAVKNGSASPITVTVQTPRTVDGMAIAERTVTVAASGIALITGFSNRVYSNTVRVDFSDVTTVTVALYQI